MDAQPITSTSKEWVLDCNTLEAMEISDDEVQSIVGRGDTPMDMSPREKELREHCIALQQEKWVVEDEIKNA